MKVTKTTKQILNYYRILRGHFSPQRRLSPDRSTSPRRFTPFLCGVLLLLATGAWADCQDPETLPEDMKKAYYQLKEAEKQIPGMTVAIRCYGEEKDKPEPKKED